MRREAPFWWYRRRGALASALAPLGRLYGRIAEKRFAEAEPYCSRLPVICIGNFTAGGGGKTPTAIAVAALLAELGARPAFLTRGYGGTSEGPVLVVKGQSAEEVGDEPLLLAEAAPTMVAADRKAGAAALEATEADLIVMDDGLQNPSLAKDLSLVVVDAAAGIGNGLIMPAGPLRAPLDRQIARSNALIVIGDGSKAAPLADAFAGQGKPVLKARMVPRQDRRWLGVLPVIGFAGIARPEKFFATLRNNGARLIDTRSYPDHYRYSERQARSLLREAKDYNAMLVTTEKDWVRLPDDPDSAAGELKHRSRPFPIAVEFDDAAAMKELLAAVLAKSA
ncbi:MAG: tetraacyldisaccharide 4'-kinase [Alphaproteobacteria bacterium RBG_16_64_48]|nr:MAG: tetraacyldisaccharide 4'-kinase [Alphaproteobacteria bacterium RBG_16_64_48]